MKRFSFTKSLALIALVTTASCSLTSKDIITKKDDTIVATYKGGKIKKSQINKEIARLKAQNSKIGDVSFENLAASQKELLVKEIILKKASLKQAKKYDLDEDKDYVDALEQFETTILQKQLYVKLAQDATKDDKVKARYEELVLDSKGKKDLKLGFILLKDEKQAKKIHKRLVNNPNSFTYYAKTKSLDENTKKNKGVLDYSIESSFPENIAKIAKGLKRKQISKPFPIGNKWGIIRLLGKRDAKIRSFEQSKNALTKNMALKAIKDFNDGVIKKAKINLILQ